MDLLKVPADRDRCIQCILAVLLIKGSTPASKDNFYDTSFQKKWSEVNSYATRFSSRMMTNLSRGLSIVILKAYRAVSMEMDDESFLGENLVEFPAGHSLNLATVPVLRKGY